MIKSQRVKSIGGMLGLVGGLKLKDIAPELPGVTEFSSCVTLFSSSSIVTADLAVRLSRFKCSTFTFF